jgi:hypothetical protein
MANYDFQSLLSPLDFEHLVRDLLSQDLGIELTAFAEGKDSGIDLRYSKSKKDSIIVQCKRVKSISKEQIDEESRKITKLNPKKYYFVVSCDLSVNKFNYIKETFKKWMKDDDSFIYTKAKLNTLLDTYKDIHQKNYKLWLNSSLIFNSLINQPLFERAKSLINDLKKDYKYYVRNESLYKAIEILNISQFIVISGIPGIGKTTLAKLILWEYLQKGFEVIEIRKLIEGEQILVEGSDNNQVFYFDDFLGENFLKFDVIEGRSNDLIEFIKRVKNSKNKILVMTTREYILNQAKEVYEKLDSDDLNIAKYTLDLSSYSKRIKTLILYNHLYYSHTPIEYIEALIKNKTYKRIINHKNYSPRIIEQLTIKLNNIQLNDYARSFLESLDYPFGIWNKAFNSQISEGSIFTLYIVLSISHPILLSDLKKVMDYSFKNGVKNRGINFKPFDYKNYLKEIENSFIKTNITDKNNHYVDFLNPSIKDFLLSLVKNDLEIVKFLLDSCFYFNQFVYTIRYLAIDFLENEEIITKIDDLIIEKFDSFTNPTTIYSSQKEVSSGLHILDVIVGLKFYLNKTKNEEIFKLFKTKFQEIEVGGLFYSNERKYIQFYKEYHKHLDVDYDSIINKVAVNIDWIEGVENFMELKSIKEKSFKKYLEQNNAELNNKIQNSIRKEIEFYDNSYQLLDFKDRLNDKYDLSMFSISIREFDSYFDERLNEIKEKEKIKEEKLDIEIHDVETSDNDEFDENEIFKIELFEK